MGYERMIIVDRETRLKKHFKILNMEQLEFLKSQFEFNGRTERENMNKDGLKEDEIARWIVEEIKSRKGG